MVRTRAIRRLPALLLPLALAVGCEAGTSAPVRWNLVLINVDTLRADHLGLHGYARPTSPALDRLAEGAAVFEQAMAASSVTRESVAALFSGRLPSRSGSYGWRATPAADSAHLGELLGRAGYRTAFLSNTVMLRDPGFARGFERVQHLPARWDLSGEGMRLTDTALAFVGRVGTPFALYLHYLDPHAPYAPDAERLARFDAPQVEAPLELYRDVEPRLPALRAEGFGPGEARFEDLVARYDAEIASTDAAIGALLAGLADRGLLERTLVVVTADHGEEFLEHGWVEHGWTLHRESLHVPLLFSAPRLIVPARVHEPVSQIDVLPSLVDLLGLDPAGAPIDGTSLFERGENGWRPRASFEPVVSELLLSERNVVRSVLWDGWRYVAAQRWVPAHERSAKLRPPATTALPSVDPWGPLVHEALYHVREDPGETRDRLAAEPERSRALRGLLAGAIGGSREPPETSHEPGVSPEDAERLRALGYSD
jgi:arylsulfatase